MNRSTTWLLWDGDCDFCRRAAAWLADRDTRHILTIIPYQEAPAPPMTPSLRVQASRQVQVMTPFGYHYSGAEAILFALQSVGWHAGIMRLARHRPFLWGAEAAYWVVARNRGRFACRTCRGS